jgi:hypothetical protein
MPTYDLGDPHATTARDEDFEASHLPLESAESGNGHGPTETVGEHEPSAVQGTDKLPTRQSPRNKVIAGAVAVGLTIAGSLVGMGLSRDNGGAEEGSVRPPGAVASADPNPSTETQTLPSEATSLATGHPSFSPNPSTENISSVAEGSAESNAVSSGYPERYTDITQFDQELIQEGLGVFREALTQDDAKIEAAIRDKLIALEEVENIDKNTPAFLYFRGINVAYQETDDNGRLVWVNLQAENALFVPIGDKLYWTSVNRVTEEITTYRVGSYDQATGDHIFEGGRLKDVEFFTVDGVPGSGQWSAFIPTGFDENGLRGIDKFAHIERDDSTEIRSSSTLFKLYDTALTEADRILVPDENFDEMTEDWRRVMGDFSFTALD